MRAVDRWSIKCLFSTFKAKTVHVDSTDLVLCYRSQVSLTEGSYLPFTWSWSWFNFRNIGCQYITFLSLCYKFSSPILSNFSTYIELQNPLTEEVTSFLAIGSLPCTANIFNVIFTLFTSVPLFTVVIPLYCLHSINAPSTVEKCKH